MICLHKLSFKAHGFENDFPQHYKTYSPGTLITNVLSTVGNVLKAEGIPAEKLEVLSTELAFLRTDQTLNNSDILKSILLELETAVIPLFNSRFISNSNYDIIGKFYEEFLKYAGVSNVKKGIVLTPRHVTTLFTKLIEIKPNDKIVDLCCGTGAFLIAGMNALVAQVNLSNRSDKEDAIQKIKSQQLLGFELNTTMYICAVSNMLFRGDGKSSIHNYDSIHDKRTQEELDKFNATIGFINPPYAGKENENNPTPKEITFLIKMLDNCSRYGIIIAPISTFLKDSAIRDSILTKHTLIYVINMPGELFQPNASTHTAVAVFETHRPFDYKKDEVTFYDLRDDGLSLSKTKGRTDVYNRWPAIERSLLDSLKPGYVHDEITSVKTKLKRGDEWNIYSHSKTDYSDLNEYNFVKPLTEYMLYVAKRNLGILGSSADEMQIFEAIGNYYSGNSGIVIQTKNSKNDEIIDTSDWAEFDMITLFKMTAGKYYPSVTYSAGDVPIVSASESNNGIMSLSDLEPTYQGNCLTIGKVGMSVYYQDGPFCASSDVTVLEPLFDGFNKHVGLYIIGVLSKQKHQWNYGNQIRLNDSERLRILLPVLGDGNPDWKKMESFVKSLPYAEYIKDE